MEESLTTAWPGPPELWAPQPGPQTAFVTCPLFEVVYGGARGGGKTDAALGDFLHHARQWNAAAKGLLVRRTRAALEPTLERAKAIYGPAGARWEASRDRFVFPGGAMMYLRPLERESDAQKLQGHDYTRIYVEELTQFPHPALVDKLKATLRSAAGAAVGFRATCNPGGPGHAWVKARYVDPGPGVVTDHETGGGRIFIPARVSDNPALLDADPGYMERIRRAGSPALARAWLEGDWSAVEGAFFDAWSLRNVIRPFVVPDHWARLRSLDWGYASPFSVGWWAIATDDTPVLSEAGPLIAPRGAMIRYREWYGERSAGSGEGLRLEAESVAAGILAREAGEAIQLAVADPSIFAQTSGPSIGERLARAGARFAPADNSRVPRAGAMSGWDQMRSRIRGVEGPDGRWTPMLFVFDTCRAFIRTVPGLTHDPHKIEDVDTLAEDHAADEARYACMARPWIPGAPPAAGPNEDRWTRLRREAQGRDTGWKVM